MKYIEKIDWEKAEKLLWKNESLIAVTLTNLGTKYKPVFQIHKLTPKTKNIEDLGLFDTDRFEKLVRKKQYNFWERVGWDYLGDFETSMNEHLTAFYARFQDYGKWVIGDLLGIPSVKISRLI